MALFGTMGGLQSGLMAALSNPNTMSMDKVPSEAPRRGRGLFGGLRNRLDPSRIAMTQAIIAGDYGAAAQIQAQRQRGRAAESEAEREAEQRASAIENLSQLTGPGGQPLFTKAQLGGMRVEDLSDLAQSIYAPAQYGATGGSQGLRDPRTGQTSYEQAPWREQVGPDILAGGPNGAPPQTISQGVTPVSVDGVGVFGMTRQGQVVGQGGLPGTPPLAQTPPLTVPPPAPNEAQLRQQAADAIARGADPAQVNRRLEEMLQGGAGGQAQTPFADPARYSRTAMAESGGRDFTASGAPLTSPRGARYAMQVMPGTAGSPGYGVSPARNSGPAEYNRVGREYIDAMVREFGSEAAGAAAYNYGPGNFRRLIARHPRDWRNHLPRETRDYLRRQGL